MKRRRSRITLHGQRSRVRGRRLWDHRHRPRRRRSQRTRLLVRPLTTCPVLLLTNWRGRRALHGIRVYLEVHLHRRRPLPIHLFWGHGGRQTIWEDEEAVEHRALQTRVLRAIALIPTPAQNASASGSGKEKKKVEAEAEAEWQADGDPSRTLLTKERRILCRGDLSLLWVRRLKLVSFLSYLTKYHLTEYYKHFCVMM